MEKVLSEMKSNETKTKSNEKLCYYCGSKLIRSQRYFCSIICNSKYWRGVYSKKWKEGTYVVKPNDKPTELELKKAEEKYQARRLAYKKLDSKEIVNCDLCGEKLKKSSIVRHHEDYKKPEVFMVVCTKCHGWIKKYNNLKKTLYSIQMKGGKK